MSELGFEHVFYLENFECAGDEVLVESSPPASPDMAARLAAPAQGGGGAGGTSPTAVRELIVIPELPNSIHLQHAMQQVSSAVVEVNGDSSGHSSPTADAQHTYITVSNYRFPLATLFCVDIFFLISGENGGGVNYHVQYVTEPQEIYTQGHQTHMEALRSYPVYGVTTVGNATATEGTSAEGEWGGASSAEYTAYGVVVAGDEAEAPASPATPAGAPQPPRMPPATVQWLLNNYETAEGVSLPRSTLYTHYLRHCGAHRLEPVNAASFGKLIRSVFVGLRTRRLGTRGNSKYHYYGIRAKPHVDGDHMHQDASDDKTEVIDAQEGRSRSGEREDAASPSSAAGAAHRQYLGAVAAPHPPPIVLAQPPDDVPLAALDALRRHHREHGVEFLEAVAALDTAAVERSRRAFWRRPPADLCRRVLCKLTAKKEVAVWLRNAELALYQTAVELLLPDVLRPIPAQLTQAIRNFAKSLESALSVGAGLAPAPAARAQASAASALAAALRRYTSLNHLAQAARAVLTNHHQINQMLADLNRVDFRVVREQAAWACSCGSAATAHKLEADFKVATLGRGASLEQWAAWLEACVRTALQPHERRPDYASRARRLLLDWSFYSSLVIRELTLRSAASFGSFHLIRLLYDEYVSFLIERRVAAHRGAPPIAVMHRALEDDDDLMEEPPRPEGEDDDPDWDWEDEEEEDDEPECKKIKMV
ncbi:hypothetical protein K1T71_004268 [Dendrolimus kikuchii]|uniref:Uncharacterized protein n=1 Tax=Dendrolimus kikuchii TaxID=765133 RepID=A0ACC1D8E8_9NEOP|nr:hypothetical protein K1T71_004268 [Dendrolimus kikuchii]